VETAREPDRPSPVQSARAGAKLAPAAELARPPKRGRRAAVEHFAGLDVSMDETAVCVVDEAGSVLMQCAVLTDPEAIATALAPFARTLRRVGHEAGALSPWLHPGMKALGLPAVCLETRHVRAAMSAQRNKTDAADALGLAHLMRTGWFRQAHVKSDGAYRLRLLLIHRRNLKRKFLDLENAIRHSLKSFGVRLNKVGRGGFDKAVREACADDALTAELMDCMLTARAALWRQYLKLHDLVVKIVARDALCRRLMEIPGVGPITALTFVTAIDDPARFRRSRNVAAYFGLTSKRWQSGTSIDIKGRISKAGDADVRRSLYEAASAMLTRYKGSTPLKTWGLKLAKRCHKKAVVAVARKLAVIMHAMWRDGSEYADRPKTGAAKAPPSVANERVVVGA
jgi:transposase